MHHHRLSFFAVAGLLAAALLVPGGCGKKESSASERAKPYVDRGFRMFREARYAEAATEWEKALEINPKLEYLRQNLGVAYYSFLDRKEDARAQWEAYMAQFPKDASVYNNLGAYYRGAGDLDKAIQMYTKAAELHNQYPTPLFNLGLIYESMGDYPTAIEKLEAAQRLVPTGIEHLTALSRIYGKAGNSEKALELAIKAKGYAAASASVNTSLAEEYLRQGKVTEARELVEQVLAANPNYGLAADVLARIELEPDGKGVEAATRILDDLEKASPDVAPAVAPTRAMIALKKDDVASARTILDAALARPEGLEADRVARVRFLLGHVMLRQGETERGQALAAEGVKTDPRLGNQGELLRLLSSLPAPRRP